MQHTMRPEQGTVQGITPKKPRNPNPEAGQKQVNNICLLGAFLLLRVLVIQTVEVAADVHTHKVGRGAGLGQS